MTIMTHAIFCDDIRQEVNGKLMYIGIYAGEMILPSLPAFFRVMAIVNISQDKNSIYRIYKIHTYMPNGVKNTIEIPNNIPQEAREKFISSDDIKRFSINANIPIQGIMTEGRIAVDVEVDGEIIRAGSLRVRALTQEDLGKMQEILPAFSLPPSTPPQS